MARRINKEYYFPLVCSLGADFFIFGELLVSSTTSVVDPALRPNLAVMHGRRIVPSLGSTELGVGL